MSTSEPRSASAGAMFAAGSVSGLIEAILVQPFDMVKTRFQLYGGKNPSIARELMNLVQEGGVGRLYRGCVPELASTMAARSVLYMSKQQGEDFVKPTVGQAAAPFIGGLYAGLPEAIATTPFQVVKVRLQSKEHLGRYKGFGHCVWTMARDGQPLQFFTGLGTTVVRNSVWNCVYFGTLPVCRGSLPTVPGAPMIDSFLSGFVCGTVATCFNAPFDVAKSRVQRQLPGETKYSSTLQCLLAVAREEGIQACYKGFAPKVLRMACGGGIGITVYELISVRMAFCL